MEIKIIFNLIAFIFFLDRVCSENLGTYIVQLDPQLGSSTGEASTKLQWHLSFLEKTVLAEESPSSRLLYSYRSAIEGFSVRLTEMELAALSDTHGVLAVHPDRCLQLHTTYSYKFLGMGFTSNGAWLESKFGQGTVIGVLDTGVWPESPSFSDHRMPPVPKKWRGVCQVGQEFNASLCNRKLIGARFYYKGHHANLPPQTSMIEYISPRDRYGHGTHTSSTAAGASVRGANVLGNGAGVAQGMAPGAHIAMYKVCWFNGCYSSDILAAIDDAIRDGVDILSLSLGGFPLPLFADSIAVGSFRATERGIVVVCAAGNNGPIPSSVANEAPWVVTVGASTLDRKFPAVVRMGDGQVLYGESVFPRNQFSNGMKELELVYGGSEGAEFCFNGTLSKARIGGKMVVCDRGATGRAAKGEVVKESGGAAMVLANTMVNLEEDSVDAHVLPATQIGYAEAIRLKRYIRATRKPMARIDFGGTIIGESRAPVVALFSSRGPSSTNPSILKPDIVAPGVNIIAAWPQNLGPSGLPEDTRKVNFSVLSGTSMSCPHVSGIASLVRAVHPSWSPAMVKSAIMTTADVTDHSGAPIMDGTEPAGVFGLGAGHVNPRRAIDPGLVYDTMPDDYIAHLCTLGYTTSEILIITHKRVDCNQVQSKNRDFGLNYPSMSVLFKHKTLRKTITRRVTNVGPPNSTYLVEVAAPPEVRVRVRPQRLTFNHMYQTKVYRVWFVTKMKAAREKITYAQGHLTWVHNYQSDYKVRSPISITWVG